MSALPQEKIEERQAAEEAFGQLLREIRAYNEIPDEEQLERAFRFSEWAHQGQVRQSREPFIYHCIEVARILAELHLDSVTIAAGLIHDVIEDTEITLDQVRSTFGNRIALLVDGVTKITALQLQSKDVQQAEYFRKMLLSMVKDIRVILIKFADRLHNMRTLDFLKVDRRRRIALETKDVYAPLAHRFGMARIRWELEDLSLKHLDPEAYYDIERKVALRRVDRERQIERIKRPLEEAMAANHIQAEITGRPKNFCSIYNKMHTQNRPFEEVHDLMAVRIIVSEVADCYHALGLVHSMFTPVMERFKDFIATPKSNMYQSLHTTVIAHRQKMEIQIRTHEMHRVAEIGIAAHWRYKEGKTTKDELDQHIGWIRDVVDRQQDTVDPDEFMEELKIELYQDEVFVFTPKGDLRKLPKGASALDFAFSVHTDIGLHCFGAKINGRMVTIGTPLQSGDTVEILTSPNQKPHRDWLKWVKTSKARDRIRRWLKAEAYADSVQLGQDILEREVKKSGLKLAEERLTELAVDLGVEDVEHLMAGLGSGEISLVQVMRKWTGEEESRPSKQIPPTSRLEVGPGVINIQGMDNLMIRISKCCRPIPGDTIVGFVTRGRGVTVHRRNCPNIGNLISDDPRRIDVEWDSDKEQTFIARILVLADDRKNLLNDMTKVIGRMEMNIRNAKATADLGVAENEFELDVKDLKELGKLMDKLRRVKGVQAVERLDRPLEGEALSLPELRVQVPEPTG